MSKSEFKYFNSPDTTFVVLGDPTLHDTYDDKHNTITFHDAFVVRNLTDQTVDDVFATLPYVWAEAPDDGTLGDPGFVALDFENGAWRAEDFNGIEGLDLKVTAEIKPLDESYTTGKIAAGSIASNEDLTDALGPSSTDEFPNSPFPPETLDGDDRIPSVNLGELNAFEEVPLDLVFTYKWTLDGKKADFDALFTAGAVFTLDDVEKSNAHHTAGAGSDLWFV
jgi:hypothetical protein